MISTTYLQVYMLIIVGNFKNFKRKKTNRTLLTDELMVFFIIYHLFCFTDMLRDPATIGLVGDSMIVVTLLILVVRIGGLLMESVFLTYTKCKL